VQDLHIQQRPGVFPEEQMALILQDPVNYLMVIARTFGSQWLGHMKGFVGKLGHFGPELPVAAGALHVFVLSLSALGAGKEGVNIGAREKLIASAIVLLSTLSFITPLYLTWTPLGGSVIEGVQGRYFMPLAPLLLMLFYRGKVAFKVSGALALVYCTSLLCYTTYVLLGAYYL
jgi:uncharacterized membrane protein